MHILILASFYPSTIRPHTGVFFQAQAEALHHAGHQVGVIVLPRLREIIHEWRQSPPRLPEITSENGDFPIYRMNYIWIPRIFPELCAKFTSIYGLRAYKQYIVQQGTPDVIHAHNIFYGGVLATQIKQAYGIPTVNTEHSSNHINGRFFLPAQKRIIKRTLDRLDLRFAVSDFLAQAMRPHHRDIQIIPNVIHTKQFQLTPPPQTSSFVFSAIGSLVPVKNFPLLIHAFTQAYQGKEAHLMIGGDGKERKKLARLIDELGMSEQITLLGRLNRTQVYNLIQKSHVIVSSSYIETFGVTLIEAMACGRPVIATRSGGPDGFITAQTGLLVNKNDVDDLAQAMQAIRENYSAYHYETMRQYCVENFSENALVQSLMNHYQSLVNE